MRSLCPPQQSDTMMCVAPIAGCRANVRGTGSLSPPSVKRSASPPEETETAGNKNGIDALARTTSSNVTL